MDWYDRILRGLMFGMLVGLFMGRLYDNGIIKSSATLPPAARPVADTTVRVDTVWLGVTWWETVDGKVIVKYERVKNPVLWDSLRRKPGKEAK